VKTIFSELNGSQQLKGKVFDLIIAYSWDKEERRASAYYRCM